jgi:hypothetical protein
MLLKTGLFGVGFSNGKSSLALLNIKKNLLLIKKWLAYFYHLKTRQFFDPLNTRLVGVQMFTVHTEYQTSWSTDVHCTHVFLLKLWL